MKLSQDILFFKLLMNYPVYFLNRTLTCEKYSYPIIYEAGADLADHVVVIQANELEGLLVRNDLSGTIFVCIGIMASPSAADISIIIVEKSVSLIGLNNFINKIYDEFEKWDSSMKDVLDENGNFQDLINCCDPVIIEPIAVMDKEFQLVASSELSKELGYNDDLDENNRLTLDTLSVLMAKIDYDKICESKKLYVFNSPDGYTIGKNIFYKDKYVGRIAIKLSTGEDYIQNYNEAILNHFFLYASKLYNKYSSFDSYEFSKYSLETLLQDSLSKVEISKKLWDKILKENKWNSSDQLQLVQFESNPRKENKLYAKYLCHIVGNKWSDSVCFTYMDHLLLLTNMTKFSAKGNLDFFQILAGFLKDNPLIAGVSRVFMDMNYLRSAYEQTETAIELGLLKNPTSWYYKFDDYALDYMLQHCEGLYEAKEICSAKLLTLIAYDNEKGTEYYKTLYTYFACRYNAAETAKRLFINRSTFHYRLDKIQELVSIDFDSNDELLYLSISFKILHV